MLNLPEDAALEEGGAAGMGVQQRLGYSRRWGGIGVGGPGGFVGSRVQWRPGRAVKAAAAARRPRETVFLALWLVLSPVDAL